MWYMKLSIRNIATTVSTATTAAYLTGYFALPAFAQANVSLCPENSDFNSLCSKNFSFAQILRTILVLMFIAAAVLALIFLIWGGIKWILSGGDKAKVDAARSTIVGALIGLALVFGAYFLLNIIFNIFLGQGVGGFNLPTF